MVRAATLDPVGTRLRVTDWRGQPFVGAKLWPVTPGSNVPKATYTDATYATEHPGALEADANGFFPHMHAPQGVEIDLLLTSPGGELLLRYESVAKSEGSAQ
jgi:hypothetical protein